MASKAKIGYFCAGIGAGTALAVLFAPKPGWEMRGQLRAAAEDGIDRFKDHAYDALETLEDTLEHKDDLIRAGKEHLRLAMESGREAYRRSVNPDPAPEMSTLGALGFLAFEAAAVVTSYQLIRGLGKGVSEVAPKLENFLDTSGSAVTNAAGEIAAVASAGLHVLRQIEKVLAGAKPAVE